MAIKTNTAEGVWTGTRHRVPLHAIPASRESKDTLNKKMNTRWYLNSGASDQKKKKKKKDF